MAFTIEVTGICQAEAFKQVVRIQMRIFEVSQLGDHDQIFPSGQYLVPPRNLRRLALEAVCRTFAVLLSQYTKEELPISKQLLH
ncbi:hypothetical protein UQ64_18020 [Paenibacillus etheri]|uniref:Uncharacterized protein n=1 Tax=Paenibacillus etheri TaxID=1306852 RepID=A0A0W1AX80_9BACL|nr:hypothetical protein UQ64_18020 [Paenibacillus etheri]